MIKIMKNISKIATAALMLKSGIELYKTGKTLLNAANKAKTGAGKANKIASAVKKGLKS